MPKLDILTVHDQGRDLEPAQAFGEAVSDTARYERAGREAELAIDHEAGPAHDVVAPPRDERADIGHRDEESRRLRSAMLAAERRALLALRDRDAIGDDVMRRIERDLDLEAILAEGNETNRAARAPDDESGA